jgi:hypothetical protein
MMEIIKVWMIRKIIMNLMTKIWMFKVIKILSFKVRKTIVISLLEIIQLRKILDRVKKKRINFQVLRKKI